MPVKILFIAKNTEILFNAKLMVIASMAAPVLKILTYTLSDFPDSLLEENGMSEMINEILHDEEIENAVKSCVKDLLDNVEKEMEISKKPNVRKRQTNKSEWVVSKRQKAVQSGKEHTNNQGKFISAKKIVSKKDCAAKCKFDCLSKIDKETQETIFLQFYKLESNAKHAYIAQTTVCSSTAAEKNARKKFSYTYFHLKGESSLRVCKSFYLSTLAISQKMVYNVHQKKGQNFGDIKTRWSG